MKVSKVLPRLLADCICLFILLASGWAVASENQSNGVITIHTAEMDADGGYLFNPNGTKEVRLSTLDWAPYIDQNICGQGWVQQVIVGAFIKKGYRVRSYFVPWKRAVSMAEMGKVDGLYPEYAISQQAKSDIFPDRNRLALLKLSKPFPGGSLVFWKRKDTNIHFDGDLSKLKNVSIGVVAGYENSPEFDALMDQGYFQISQSLNDWQNVRKLFKERIELIIGDPLVLDYAIHSNLSPDKVYKYLETLEALEPNLAEHFLYIAFSRKNALNETKRAEFDDAITDMHESDEIGRIKRYFQARSHLNTSCNPQTVIAK